MMNSSAAAEEEDAQMRSGLQSGGTGGLVGCVARS